MFSERDRNLYQEKRRTVSYLAARDLLKRSRDSTMVSECYHEERILGIKVIMMMGSY